MQINRLFGIIYILLNKKSVTAKELAEHFEVSVRTIYRDIDTLSFAGIPIFASQGKGGGISLMEDYVLDKSLLSEKEQKEILYALQSLSTVQVPDADKILAKLSNLFNKNEINWIEVDFSPWGSSEEGSLQFAVIKEAILSHHILEFNYFSSSGKKSIRRVKPFKLVFKVNAWYLQAFCLTKNAYRAFKITRMSDVLKTTEPFSEKDLMNPDSPEAGRNQTQNWIDVCLKISADGAYRVYDEFDENDIRKDEDESFTITTSLPEGKWLISYILSFGADATVLAPQSIRDLVYNEIKEINNNYKI